MTYAKEILALLAPELWVHANRRNAIGAQAYMRDIAPFLGVKTPERRSAVKKIAKSLPVPSSDELGATARLLWRQVHREFQYAAYDLIDIHVESADKKFLAQHVEHLLVTKSWWDTVDGLGSAAVSPLTEKFGCAPLIKKWNSSPNMWLNRAAIQHQRGRKFETDVKLVLQYCNDHSDSKEFFIVKAIGWALRDLSRINPRAVREFLTDHPDLGRVAVREAEKGLSRI